MNDFKDFLCDYQRDGRKWSVVIKATSLADARAHLHAIRMNGAIGGTLHETIQFAPDRFGRFYTWLRNVSRPAPASGEGR